jgi:methyltransferase (TIGR00027 family)
VAESASRTGQLVALVRAELDRPSSTQGNPDAQRTLCSGMSGIRSTASAFAPQVAARTQFFDDQVVRALSAGIDQVVICGAGYDDRAWRFRTAGVRFFELDHPGTQADKRSRLRAARFDTTAVKFVTADFAIDDVAELLDDHGHDGRRASLFLCEGLLVYLSEPVAVRLLAGLRRRGAPGSVLAASLAVHREGLDSPTVVATANARRRSGGTEPWRTILPLDAHLDLFAQAGWRVAQHVDAATLSSDAAPGRTILVAAEPAEGVEPA